NIAEIGAMLPPRRILKAPGQVAAAASRSAGTTGIEIAHREPMLFIELVVDLAEILIRVVRSRNIALPPRVSIRKDHVRLRDIGVEDLYRDRVHAVWTDHVRHTVADECSVGRRVCGLCSGGSKVTRTLESGRYARSGQECAC